MAKKFNIDEQKENLKFYLDRLHYYKNLIYRANECDDPDEFKARGYGLIYFEVGLEMSQKMYDHWFRGMIEFIHKEQCRGCEKKQ
jgi:hypothetical protein